jgi:zinc-ribbon family
MNCFFIIGTHFFTWGSGETPQQMRCGRCGTVSNFQLKRGMSFITLFFVIPVIPISGIKPIAQCPSCKARYQAPPELLAGASGGSQFR